jgi:hypothetical protein
MHAKWHARGVSGWLAALVGCRRQNGWGYIRISANPLLDSDVMKWWNTKPILLQTRL